MHTAVSVGSQRVGGLDGRAGAGRDCVWGVSDHPADRYEAADSVFVGVAFGICDVRAVRVQHTRDAGRNVADGQSRAFDGGAVLFGGGDLRASAHAVDSGIRRAGEVDAEVCDAVFDSSAVEHRAAGAERICGGVSGAGGGVQGASGIWYYRRERSHFGGGVSAVDVSAGILRGNQAGRQPQGGGLDDGGEGHPGVLLGVHRVDRGASKHFYKRERKCGEDGALKGNLEFGIWNLEFELECSGYKM